MPARDHITIIQKSTGVVKPTQELEQKAEAEVKKPDPANIEEVVTKNTLKTEKVKKE